MGNSDSKTKDTKQTEKGSGGDDGCIGNRRVRTIVLSCLLIVFFVFATPYIQVIEQNYRDCADLTTASTYCDDFANAFAIILTGAIISIIGAIAALLLFIIPNCDDKLGRVAGIILILGGLLYLIGWIWYASSFNDQWNGFILTDEQQRRFDAGISAFVGEAILPSVTAILLGIDALMQFFENEAGRLASNLGLICTVSLMCVNAYYLQICSSDDASCTTPDGVAAIATGYVILFWTTLVYIILYIFTCCTCDCKDRCLIRVLFAVFLIIGGVLCAIGYWVYSGGAEAALDENNVNQKWIAFYVGYSILIGGLCATWALDIALDDIKQSRSG